MVFRGGELLWMNSTCIVFLKRMMLSVLRFVISSMMAAYNSKQELKGLFCPPELGLEEVHDWMWSFFPWQLHLSLHGGLFSLLMVSSIHYMNDLALTYLVVGNELIIKEDELRKEVTREALEDVDDDAITIVMLRARIDKLENKN